VSTRKAKKYLSFQLLEWASVSLLNSLGEKKSIADKEGYPMRMCWHIFILSEAVKRLTAMTLKTKFPPKNWSASSALTGSVVAAVKNSGAKHVLDVGCGEGHLPSFQLEEVL
jgi:2-polyprenyl-3-methyl-5-hydroxy-6-metoxy-1,4-benzoquinol methylase